MNISPVAILAGLGAMLGRFAGQLLNTTLGWATLLLFGKVPANRQLLLLVIVFGSLAWVVLVVGVVVPTVGALLLSGVSLPSFVDLGWVRLGMLIGAIFLPAIIGGLATMVAEKASRPTGFGLIGGILRGYPFAAVLALIMVILAGVATVRKARSLAKRWEDTHIPIVVKPGKYDQMLSQLSYTLQEAGLDHQARSAGQIISGPPKLLDLVAGRALGALVPDRLMLLAGPDFEALVYPSDVAISGKRQRVARARAAISSQLTHAPAYLTTSAESQKFEDRLTKAKAPADFHGLDDELVRLAVPYEEWDVLYRKRLQSELEMVNGKDESLATVESAPSVAARAPSRPALTDLAVAGAGIGLIALDAALVVTSRERRKR